MDNNNELVRENLPFIQMKTRMYKPYNQSFDEAYSSALFGVAISLKSFDPTKSKFITFINKSILWRMIYENRKKAAPLPFEEIEIPVKDNNIKHLENKEIANRLLNTLCRRDKSIIKLLYGIDSGYSLSAYEIAKVLRISHETVYKRIRKAIKRMKYNYDKLK